MIWEGGVFSEYGKKGVRDLITSLDHQVFLEDLYVWKNNKNISKKDRDLISQQEKFFKKVVNDKWWKTVNQNKEGDYKANNPLEKKNGEYLWRRTENGSHTKEARIAIEIDKMNKRYDKMKANNLIKT